ncbi:uncharacterized protein LOC125653344 isoform X2 [Ostrea edulis]|uniref:uncharacterized protein LOC125653344 isoform X2 n=1 Tax=Ostrea edulis TaxID=37623 RepID=UPI0024AF3073|nr:uncharacterized protein LOC125653344 isoform X2 [Ostrea edulis]XP_056000711.1 uncharacterized protein LOC125653344 isoform X2 [Ostrea edulis]
MKFEIVLTILVVIETATTCPPNLVSHNGICCQYVTCKSQQYVKVCEKNGEPDVCHPCPGSTYLDDPTDSYFVFPCLEKNCGEDTIPSDYPATRFDSTACSKRCRCNTAINYCGTDPCKCRHHMCFPGEVLHENCTCVRVEARLTSTTNFRTPTSEDGRASQLPSNGFTGHSTPSGRSTITVDPRFTSEPTESEKDIGEPKVRENDHDREETNPTWIPYVIIIGFVPVGFVFVVVVYRWKGRKVVYTQVDVHNDNTVINYDNCNVQVGNNNDLNVCNKVTKHDTD